MQGGKQAPWYRWIHPPAGRDLDFFEADIVALAFGDLKADPGCVPWGEFDDLGAAVVGNVCDLHGGAVAEAQGSGDGVVVLVRAVLEDDACDGLAFFPVQPDPRPWLAGRGPVGGSFIDGF